MTHLKVDLKKYMDKCVPIIADNGEEFIGIVEDFFYDDENDLNEESIIIKTKNSLVEFTKGDISHIEIL